MENKEEKEILLKIRELFEDLKVSRSGSVRGFIFDSLYSILGNLEATIDKIFKGKSDLEKELARSKRQTESERKLRQLQSEFIAKTVEEEKEIL